MMDIIDQRVVRFNQLIPCKTAFIDARTPGSDKKENFCIIGGGVAENPGQVVHIDIPHPFDIGAAKQPNGCKNSHHSHDTEEVFFVHQGKWQFTWGESGSDGAVVLTRGDTVSFPTELFRGFENIGDDDGFLLSVLGQNKDGTPGSVIWAPYVFKNAKAHGMVLLTDGRLIDTAAGEKIPPGIEEEQPPTRAVMDSYHKLTSAEMAKCVCRQTECDAFSGGGGHNHLNGVKEIPIIGIPNPAESMPEGKMNWAHGFHVRRLILAANATIAPHRRSEEEVIFIHSGCLTLMIDDTTVTLNQGDVITIPISASRQFQNNSQQPLDAIVVRGGDTPKLAIPLN